MKKEKGNGLVWIILAILVFALILGFVFIKFGSLTGKVISTSCNISSKLTLGAPTFVYGANGGDYYTYAPSIILDSGIKRIWTCHNFNSGKIVDNIGYNQQDQSLGKSVLAPGNQNSWDSYHTCDPSVVYGPFIYQGKSYDYALFYLGYDLAQTKKNQIGVAFSNSLEAGGNWTKYNKNPLVPYRDPIPGNSFWGTGQPSAININGNIWLFYTIGDSYGTRVEYKIYNPKNLSQVLLSGKVTTKGLKNVVGGNDWLNNVDFAYLPDKDSFLIIRDKHFNKTRISLGSPDYMSSAVEIDTISKSQIETGTWAVTGIINQSISKFPRNHNAGIIRNKKGLIFSSNLNFIFTTSCSEGSCGNKIPEWSYDLYQISGSWKC